MSNPSGFLPCLAVSPRLISLLLLMPLGLPLAALANCVSDPQVTTAADNGAGSLRQAIVEACPNSTIRFAGDLAVQLTSTSGNPLIIDKALTIDGAGHTVSINGPGDSCSASNGCGVFVVSSGAAFTLSNLTVTGGKAENGGAIDNNGNTTIRSVSFSGHRAGSYGGVIHNNGGTLSVTGSTLSGTTFATYGGGISSRGGGTVTINQSSISGNTAVYGAGIAISHGDGSLTLTNTKISGNQGYANGGGIHLDGGSGTVTANLIDSAISDNLAGAPGGGLSVSYGTVTLENTTVSGNSSNATSGGLNLTSSTATLNKSRVIGNTTSGPGAGISSGGGSLTIKHSTISGNTGGSVGAGINSNGALTISNSTLSGNTVTASVPGGGIYSTGTTTLTNVTISGNSIGSGDGMGAGVHRGEGTLTLTNTLLADNLAGSELVNCSASVTNGGNNLEDGTSCGWGTANGSLSSTDPQLGTLGSYGGLTETVRLLDGSPALGAGDATACASAPVSGTDQRGRTRDGACDIGAFELQSASLCGPAANTLSLIAPSRNLCAAGLAGEVTATSNSWNWACQENSATPAQCSASVGVENVGGEEVSFELTDPAGCSVQDVSLVTPPAGGPVGVRMPYGVLAFDLVGCSGSTVTVRTTYSRPVEGMQFYKYVDNAWLVLPDVSVSGNTATFSIVDNGPYDSNPDLGGISDPVGPGFVPAAAQAVPTLSVWGLLGSAGLLALMGGWALRRSRSPGRD